MKFLIPSVLLTAAIDAQQLLVVPAAHGAVDAPSRTTLVGGAPERTQIVIDASMLGSLAGHRVDAILFRRDWSLVDSLTQGTWSVVLRMGPASHGSSDVRPDYSANETSPVEVFRGMVNTPASTIPTGAPSWSATDSVRIDLATPYVVGSGPLLIDLETYPQGSEWWPVDALDEAVAGNTMSLGNPCGVFANWPRTSFVADEDLVIGRTVRFRVQGESGAPAYLLVGAAPTSLPIDMSVIGAPGCFLHLLPFAAIGRVVGAPQFTAEFGGTAWVDLHLPADANLLGASLTTQWFEWQTTGFAFSNALVVQVSANPPSLGMALVTGQIAGTPVVRSYGIPVIGFVTD